MVSNGAGSALVEKEEFIEVLPLPEAGFTYAFNDRTITFQNTSTDADSYIWNFGDGFGSDEENPEYTYTTSGTYDITLIARNGCGRDTSVVNINLNQTSIQEPAWANQFTLYPNPNRGIFRLSAEGLTTTGGLSATMFDVTGQKIYQGNLQNISGRIDHTVEVADLPKGIYLFRVSNGDGAFYRKISIQ